MGNKTKEEQDAIAAFLARTAPTKVSEGSAVGYIEEDKMRADIRASMAMPNINPRGKRHRAGMAAHYQKHESRVATRIGSKQLAEKGLTPDPTKGGKDDKS